MRHAWKHGYFPRGGLTEVLYVRHPAGIRENEEVPRTAAAVLRG
ncbi:hypothetical protein HMPREF1548_01378 [Clostridium sp. KLE 1755]|nr:hypothetical protein HMPREF1548_01378 [Clostridium sp. KLE 1755]